MVIVMHILISMLLQLLFKLNLPFDVNYKGDFERFYLILSTITVPIQSFSKLLFLIWWFVFGAV